MRKRKGEERKMQLFLKQLPPRPAPNNSCLLKRYSYQEHEALYSLCSVTQ